MVLPLLAPIMSGLATAGGSLLGGLGAIGSGAMSGIGSAGSFLGKGLGFTGKGGSLMKGLGNVNKVKNMFGGGPQQESPPTDVPQPEPDQEVGGGGGIAGGFDLGSYLPQYYNGGVPNKGNPAVIYDMRSGKPTGTMNEKGPETIVPAYAGDGGFSLVDEEIKTPNITEGSQYQQNAPSSNIPNLYKYKVDPKLIGEQEDQAMLNELGKYQGAMTGAKGNSTKFQGKDSDLKKIVKRTPTATEGKDKEGFMGMGDFGDAIKTAARMYGYYTDTKRNNWGLGKSGVTRFMDNVDALDASKKKKGETLKTFEEKERIKAKYRDKDKEDIGFEEKEAIKAKYRRPSEKADEDIKIREKAYNQMQEDIKGNIFVGKKGGDPTEAEQNQYLEDQMRLMKKGERPEYKEVTKKEKSFWHPISGKDVTTSERTGEYVDVTGNQSEQDISKSPDYLAWLQTQPKGAYKSKAEAQAAYIKSKGA